MNNLIFAGLMCAAFFSGVAIAERYFIYQKIYTGSVFEQSIKKNRCYARYLGENVWVECDKFFGNKRLEKTR